MSFLLNLFDIKELDLPVIEKASADWEAVNPESSMASLLEDVEVQNLGSNLLISLFMAGAVTGLQRMFAQKANEIGLVGDAVESAFQDDTIYANCLDSRYVSEDLVDLFVTSPGDIDGRVEEIIRDKIMMIVDGRIRQDYSFVFNEELDESSTPEELTQAVYKIAGRFNPEKYPLEDEGAFEQFCEEVFDAEKELYGYPEDVAQRLGLDVELSFLDDTLLVYHATPEELLEL